MLSFKIWEFGGADEILCFNKIRLENDVAIDSDKQDFQNILSEDINPRLLKTKYMKNYELFYNNISDFKQNTATQWEQFCKMLLGKKLFVLFVVCDS